MNEQNQVTQPMQGQNPMMMRPAPPPLTAPILPGNQVQEMPAPVNPPEQQPELAQPVAQPEVQTFTAAPEPEVAQSYPTPPAPIQMQQPGFATPPPPPSIPVNNTVQPPVAPQAPVVDQKKAVQELKEEVQPGKESFSKEMVVQNRKSSLAVKSFGFDLNSPWEKLMQEAQCYIDSGLCKLTTPGAVISVVKMGMEVGLPPMVALNNIHNIEGKPTLGVHAVIALLQAHGVYFNILENFHPYTEGDVRTTIQFFDMETAKIYEDKVRSLVGLPDLVAKEMMEMYAPLKKSITLTYSWTWADAVATGNTHKQTWQKHPKAMLLSRTLVSGGRIFKGKALCGMYEASEMLDTINADYEVMEDSAGYAQVVM